MASHAPTTCRSPSGVPGRGFKKLTGTSVGSRARSCRRSSTRWASLSPMPTRAPQHSSMPCARTSRQVSARSSQPWVVTTAREERACRLDVVVVAVHAPRRQAPGLVVGEDAGRHGHVQPGALAHQGHELEEPGHDALVGPAHGEDDAELRGPQLGRLGRGGQDLVGVEEGRGLHRRVEARRLRAEVAVLGASPRSWPTGCPPPRRWARTTPAAPRGPPRRAPSPTRRAPPPGPPIRRRRAGGARRAGPRPAAAMRALASEALGGAGRLHRAGLDGRSQGDGATRGGSGGVGWHRHTVAAGPGRARTARGRARNTDPNRRQSRGVGLRDRTRVRGQAGLGACPGGRGDPASRDPGARLRRPPAGRSGRSRRR